MSDPITVKVPPDIAGGKTIKQIATELGVSKTAVRKKMTDEVKTKFAVTVSGTVFISEEGETLIKSAFSSHQPETTGNQFPPMFPETSANQFPVVSGQVSTEVSTLLDFLYREIDGRDKQLAVKDKQLDELNSRLAETSSQISDLTAALVTAQQTAQAAQALHAGTIQAQLGDGSKRGFFSRIFGGRARADERGDVS